MLQLSKLENKLSEFVAFQRLWEQRAMKSSSTGFSKEQLIILDSRMSLGFMELNEIGGHYKAMYVESFRIWKWKASQKEHMGDYYSQKV